MRRCRCVRGWWGGAACWQGAWSNRAWQCFLEAPSTLITRLRPAMVLQVFAPLARLLGLYTIKEELEELSFK